RVLRRLAARQAGAGGGTGCLSRLLRQAAVRFPPRPQPARPRVLPLAERTAGGVPGGHHPAGRAATLLMLARAAFAGAIVLLVAVAQAQTPARILVQSSPLAGFQFHEGRALWDELEIGDELTLVREPDNPY